MGDMQRASEAKEIIYNIDIILTSKVKLTT